MTEKVQSPGGRAAAQREALLSLSRSLARSRLGGVLSDALDVVLGGLGATRGAVFKTAGGATIELVADRGLTAEVRRTIERLPLSDPQWFIAQRAAKGKKTVVESDLASSSSRGGVDPKALAAAGWVAAAAVPIVVGREVIGVFCAAHPDSEPFTAEPILYLETAANVVALALGNERQADSERRDGGRRVQTAQMAALGMLATGVADELRGPLGALALQLKEQERIVAELRAHGAGVVREAEQLAELTAEASQAVRRSREITARLLAAVQGGDPESVELGALVREALASLEPGLTHRGITLEAAIDPECVISGRPEELQQTIVNLVTNAADATEVARVAGSTARRVQVGLANEGNRISLTVEDSGPGVPADLRGRIFDPFFTTKQRAIGIGLTLTKQTVLAHHGHIELGASNLGGALFRLVLPADVGDAQPGARKPVTTPPMAQRTKRGERPRILWIDDDDLFLRSMKRALADWDMQTAQTVADAERQLELAAAPEVVFCDVMLPDGSGHELHERFREKKPDLARRFVFVTGGVVTPEIADYLIASGCQTLLKPVKIEEIRSLLSGAAIESVPASAHTLREEPSVPPRSREAERFQTPPPPADPMTTTLKSSADTATRPRLRDAPTAREIPAVKERPPPPPPPEPGSKETPPAPLVDRRTSDTVREGKKKPEA